MLLLDRTVEQTHRGVCSSQAMPACPGFFSAPNNAVPIVRIMNNAAKLCIFRIYYRFLYLFRLKRQASRKLPHLDCLFQQNLINQRLRT